MFFFDDLIELVSLLKRIARFYDELGALRGGSEQKNGSNRVKSFFGGSTPLDPPYGRLRAKLGPMP